MKKIIYSISVILMLTSCGGPLDKKYNETTLAEDIKAIKENGSVDSTDLLLIAKYIIAKKLKKEEIPLTKHIKLFSMK